MAYDLRSARCWGLRIAAVVLAAMSFRIAVAEPINLDLVKQQAQAYYDDGYQQDLAAVGATAQWWIKWRAPQVTRPALVLDIDETSLSNWPELKANDFGYIRGGPCHLPDGPCGTLAWDRTGKAKAIEPTLELFKVARSIGVSVFFITGRHEIERAATSRNLLRAGYVDEHGGKGWIDLRMERNGAKPASVADFKAPQRAQIESSGYDIIANVGDQQSDLAGGHAERTFKLPNPFYYIP